MKGNVLVIGNSGVGKSTLINAVLGDNVAKTGWGTKGTTEKLEIYDSNEIPFRIIDTIGFEPSFFKKRAAINAVKKWSKNAAKEGNTDNKINMIWFCIDGTSSKLFPETIKNLSSATSIWESVPIIVVITKSYATPEREKNIEMVTNAFAQQKKHSKNLRKIIPVVASPFVLDDTAFAAPAGITELIDATNDLMPIGIKSADEDIAKFKLNRKRALAQSVVGTATTTGVIVGAVPIPFSDALLLSPIEFCEITALAKIYGIKNDKDSKRLWDSIIEIGTVSGAAKTLISALKAIPGINIAAGVLNAVIAGIIVSAIGEGCIYVFEQIYLGNKTVHDIDWITKIIESKFGTELITKITPALEKITNASNKKDIVKIILDVFFTKGK